MTGLMYNLINKLKTAGIRYKYIESTTSEDEDKIGIYYKDTGIYFCVVSYIHLGDKLDLHYVDPFPNMHVTCLFSAIAFEHIESHMKDPVAEGCFKKFIEGEHKEMDYTHKLLEECQCELRNAHVGTDKYTNGRNSINYLAIPFGGLLLAELIGLRHADGSEGSVLLIDYYHHESRCITSAEEARIQIKDLVREVNNNRWQGELSRSTSPAKINSWAENKGYTLRPRTDTSSSREEVTLNVNAMVKVYGNITETLQVHDVLIKNVIFQDPATIVFWADGEKTVVKTQNGEPYDPEKGLAMAIAKRALGNDRNYYRPFLKWIGKYNKKKAKETKELANKIVDKMKAGDWDGVGDLVKDYKFKYDDAEKVKKLHAEGKSLREIAEILGWEESPIRLLDATDEGSDQ